MVKNFLLDKEYIQLKNYYLKIKSFMDLPIIDAFNIIYMSIEIILD